MLKKLFKIGMLASLMFVAYNANAQEKTYQLEYPKYGFWSNWSIGGSVMYSWEYEHGGLLQWREGGNLGANLFFEKELSHIWAMRLVAETPGLFKAWKNDGPEGPGYDRNGIDYDRYGKIGFDFKFSLTGVKRGYDPDRKGNLYLFAGMGFSMSRDDVELGFIGMYVQGGLGWSYKICEHSTIFFEIADDICADIPNPIHQWHDMTGMFKFGWMYNFGPTQTDLDLIAQRAMLTQENFDKMASEIDGLRNDLRDAKTREAKLINRINELEANQNNTNTQIIQAAAAENGAADSLRKIIEGYENNKHNFYALPFSITYDVDQYTVPEDQMNKINAIAQIMKDNEDVKFEIIGYCDYSGSDAYNQKLSEKRAEYVKKLLVRKGVAEDRLTTSGKGKTMPFGDIKNAINRRVSFYRVNN